MAKKISPILQMTINKINKQYGKDNFITIGPSVAVVSSFPSGIFSVDLALGIGGWPLGGIIEIYGPESTGKTSVAMQGIKAYQEWQKTLPDDHKHKDRFSLVVDAEHTLVGTFFDSMDIDMDKVLYCRVDSAEEAFNTMLDLVGSEQIGFCFLDSIDALQNEKMLRKRIGENDVGGISKDTSRFFREYSKKATATETTSMFLNQIKHNPGQMFGN